ncbi:MAG: transporter [Acidobacteriia bacterium]|nr:transporter [Terriglobia bacterium]
MTSVPGVCRFAVAALAGIAALPCFAQNPPPEIVTDRPDVTESGVVVPLGSLQFENGFAWTRDHGRDTLDLSETLIRLGLWRRTEIRFVTPNYISATDGRPDPSGFDDVGVSVKHQLGPLPGRFDLAVIVGASLPTGAHDVSTHAFDPFLKFGWSRDLADGWSLGGMQSLFYATEDGRRNPTWEPTFYLEREITKRPDAFVEYAGDYPRTGGARQLLHCGAAYRPTPRHQVDFHFGFGLSHAAPNRFFAAGYSFRIDGLFGAGRQPRQ